MATTKTKVKPAEKKVETKPAAKTVEKKTEVKPAAKTTAKKAETKTTVKAAEKKAETKPAAKTTAKKAETKTTAKKPATKKAVKKENNVFVQFQGMEFDTAAIEAAVKADYTAKNGKKTMSSVSIYIKPEDMKAYYVIDGIIGDVAL